MANLANNVNGQICMVSTRLGSPYLLSSGQRGTLSTCCLWLIQPPIPVCTVVALIGPKQLSAVCTIGTILSKLPRTTITPVMHIIYCSRSTVYSYSFMGSVDVSSISRGGSQKSVRSKGKKMLQRVVSSKAP